MLALKNLTVYYTHAFNLAHVQDSKKGANTRPHSEFWIWQPPFEGSDRRGALEVRRGPQRRARLERLGRLYHLTLLKSGDHWPARAAGVRVNEAALQNSSAGWRRGRGRRRRRGGGRRGGRQRRQGWLDHVVRLLVRGRKDVDDRDDDRRNASDDPQPRQVRNDSVGTARHRDGKFRERTRPAGSLLWRGTARQIDATA